MLLLAFLERVRRGSAAEMAKAGSANINVNINLKVMLRGVAMGVSGARCILASIARRMRRRERGWGFLVGVLPQS